MPFGPVQVLLGNSYQNFLEASSCKQEHSSAGGPHASLLGPRLYSHRLPAPNDLFCEKVFSGACHFSWDSRRHWGFKGLNIS